MAYAQVICLNHGDRALIDRCLQNDADAFDEVVVRYKNKVYNYICRMIHNDHEAEDLTQEVFIRMFTSLASFRNQSSLHTWIFRIASNLCIDYYRRNKKHQNIAYSLDEPIDNEETQPSRDIPDNKYNPYKVFERGELNKQIEDALKQLPEKLRAVIILHDIEDLPYEDISHIVGCPLGTVKSRLFNARMQLREKLSMYVQA